MPRPSPPLFDAVLTVIDDWAFNTKRNLSADDMKALAALIVNSIASA